MPLLPRNNNLDFNEDATIQASKQIRSISLQNMKNPLIDPDSNTLSAMTNEKSLNNSFDEFSKMLLSLQNLFIKAKQEGIRIVEIASKTSDSLLGSGKKKSKKPKSDMDSLYDALNTYEEKFQPASIRSAEETGRFEKMSNEDYSDRLASEGADADSFITDPDFEMEYNIPNFYKNRFDGDGDDYYDNGFGLGDDTNTSHSSAAAQVFTNRDPNTNLSNLILEITKQIRNMDILLVSKIKPEVQKLDSAQITSLSQAYQTITDLWKNFSVVTFRELNFTLGEYIKDVVSFGAQIIKILEEEIKNLKINLLIVVNSYKQNEAIPNPFLPNTFWKNHIVKEMEGSGRTFTGRNNSCRDIPTIWKGAVRESAYKYML